MGSEVPKHRPESPKKKFRPSSTTNDSEYLSAGQSEDQNMTDALQPENDCGTEINGLCPTRKGKQSYATSHGESDVTSFTEGEACSIQEEVVSSSENTVSQSKKTQKYSAGDADSLTNDPEDQTLDNGTEVENPTK